MLVKTPLINGVKINSFSKEDVSFEKFYAFDSSTFTLFSEVMKGVGRNRKDDGKKKGGLKVHMQTDVHADTAVFVAISEARMHDKEVSFAFESLKRRHAGFRQGVNFACRLKDNAKAQLQEVLFEKTLSREEMGVYRVEHIHLDYKREKKPGRLCLRLVYYKDEKGWKYKFITNK